MYQQNHSPPTPLWSSSTISNMVEHGPQVHTLPETFSFTTSHSKVSEDQTSGVLSSSDQRMGYPTVCVIYDLVSKTETMVFYFSYFFNSKQNFYGKSMW